MELVIHMKLKMARLKELEVILTFFSDGIDEPVKKIIYPDLNLNRKNGKLKNNCFLVRGFQPPLLNVKPRSQLEMNYKIKKRHKKSKI